MFNGLDGGDRIHRTTTCAINMAEEGSERLSGTGLRATGTV